MGESITPTERQQLVHRHRMRVRTIAVSFAAAVASAHRDMDLGPAERDALIETWRAWSIEVLERYGREIDELRGTADAATSEELDGLHSTVAAAIERVRQA
ncbi:MAG TPA: hypothetical protein VLA59_01690 [Patescibacteria group bacterium]|nr:hypothetical protein [Patescibacteria group bacterium]